MLLLIFVFGMFSPVVGFEINSGRSNGIGKTIILSKPTVSETLSTGILSKFQYFSVEFGYSNRYDLKELNEFFFAAGYKSTHVSLLFGVSQFGNTDYYSEKLYRFGFGYDISSFTFTGFTSVKQIDFNNVYPNLSAHSYSLSAGWQSKNYLICISSDGINSPSFNVNSSKVVPKYNIYLELTGNSIYILTGKVTWQKGEKKQLGIGQKIQLSNISSLTVGFSNEPNTFGGGLELLWKEQMFNYTALYHPELGFVHNFSWQINFFKD